MDYIGTTGSDSLTGGKSDDLLSGGKGSDTLSGGNGADVLVGGKGDDFLIGDEGGSTFSDTFRFVQVSSSSLGDLGTDTILDFGSGDIIELVGVNIFTVGSLDQVKAVKIASQGSDTKLSIDTTGDATPDLFILLKGQYDPSQFLLSISSGGSLLKWKEKSTSTAAFTFSAQQTSVGEGSTATFTLSSTNVASGSSLTYTLSGVAASDITGGSLSGTTTVGSNGQATISVPIAADQTTEGSETLTVTVQGKSASVDFPKLATR